MKIYLDSDFKCHLSDDGTRKVIETNAFDNRCKEFIEGYRFVPSGETWTREDGEVFTGEMISPLRDYTTLDEIQSAVNRVQEELDDAYQKGVDSI